MPQLNASGQQAHPGEGQMKSGGNGGSMSRLDRNILSIGALLIGGPVGLVMSLAKGLNMLGFASSPRTIDPKQGGRGNGPSQMASAGTRTGTGTGTGTAAAAIEEERRRRQSRLGGGGYAGRRISLFKNAAAADTGGRFIG
jgi:hypothetical protein